VSIKTGDDTGFKRVGDIEEDSKRQRLGSVEQPQLSTHLESLPLEVLEELAQYFKEREDLTRFSKISYLTKGAALREINLQNKSLAITELQVLSDVNPPKPENPLSVIDFFQDILADRRDPNFANLFPGAQIDVDKLQELQKKLIALATAQVAEKFTKLELECNRGIANGDVSIESIDEKYASLKGALVCEALEFVISSSVDPEAGRGNLVRKAAQSGHSEVVKALLGKGHISELDTVRALVKASEKGHLEVVKCLLANAAQISKEKRGLAVSIVVEYGHLPIVKALLANGEISEDHRDSAVMCAAEHGHLQVVQALLDNGQISEFARGWAVVEKAIPNGHLEVVKCLLANGEISKAHRGSAVVSAAEKGHSEVVKALLANREISEADRVKAIIRATKNGDLEVAQFLLANLGQISEQERGWAISQVAEHGHLTVVEALLANGEISINYRGSAVLSAAEKGHIEIINCLLASGEISRMNRGWAVALAAQSGYLRVVQALLAGGVEISEYYRYKAVDVAKNNGHDAIVNFLEQK
jgi:ankyrin repeat protein